MLVHIYWRPPAKLCWRRSFAGATFTSKTAPAKFKTRKQNLRCASKINNPIFVIYGMRKRNVLCVKMCYPLHASGTPPTKPQPTEPPKKQEKRASRSQRIDRRTRPISCGGSNQREPPVLPDSPSPCKSADTLFANLMCT